MRSSAERGLGCQNAISPPVGLATTLRQPGRPLARLEQHRGAEPAGALGDLVDALDLDVGQPHRAARTALDDPAAEAAAELERR